MSRVRLWETTGGAVAPPRPDSLASFPSRANPSVSGWFLPLSPRRSGPSSATRGRQTRGKRTLNVYVAMATVLAQPLTNRVKPVCLVNKVSPGEEKSFQIGGFFFKQQPE